MATRRGMANLPLSPKLLTYSPFACSTSSRILLIVGTCFSAVLCRPRSRMVPNFYRSRRLKVPFMVFALSSLKSAQHVAVAALLAGLGACSSQQPAASPFSTAETEQALAPVRRLRAHCYDSSALAHAGKKIVLDFKLEVEPSGSVRAIPIFVEPDDPEVIECVRNELNQVRFPARGRDRLDLHFEMGH